MLISLLLAIIVLTLASFAKVLDDKKRQRFLDILSQASKQRSEEENAFIDNTVNDVLNGLNINLSKDKVNNIKQIFRENNINSLTKNPKVQKKISSIRAELNEKNNTASNYRNSIPYEPDPHGYNKAIYTEDDAFEVDEDENFVYPPFKSVDHEISNADDELFGYSFDDKDALNVDEVKTGDGNDAYTCKAKDDDIIVKNCLHFNDEQRIILNKNTNIEKIDLLKDAFLMWPKDNKVKKLFLDGLKIVENAKNIKNIGFKRKNGQNSILAIDDNNITGTFRSFSGEITLDATNNRRMNVNCIYDNTDDDGRTIECVLDVEGGEQRCPMFGEILIDKKNYIIGENNPVDEITVFGSSVSFLSCPDNNGTARVKIGNFPEEAEEKEEEVEVENSDEETESDVFLKKETDIEIDVEGIANCNTLKIEIDKKTNEIINIYASAKQEGEENKEMVDEPEKAIFKINNDVSFKNTDEDALKVNIKGIALKKYYRESLEGGGFYYHIESADGMGNETQESCFIESDKIQLNAAYDNGRVFEAMDIYDDKITLFPKNGKIEELYNNGLKIINKGENIYSITISRKTGRIIDVKGKSASRGEDFTPLKGAYMIGDTAVYVDGCNIGRLRQKDSYSGNKGNGNAIEIESANMLTINDDGTRSFAFDALNRGIVVTKYRGDLSDRRGKIGIINSTTRMFEDNNDTVNFIKLCDFHKKGLRRIQIGVDKKAKTVSVEGAVECPPEEQKSEEDIGDYSLLPNDIQTINDACVVERKQPIVDNRSLIEFPPPEEKLNEEKKEEEKKEEEKKEEKEREVKIVKDPHNPNVYSFAEEEKVEDFAFCNVRINSKRDPNDGTVYKYLTWTKNEQLKCKLTKNCRINLEDASVAGTLIKNIILSDQDDVKIPINKNERYTVVPVKKATEISFNDNKTIKFQPAHGTMLKHNSINEGNDFGFYDDRDYIELYQETSTLSCVSSFDVRKANVTVASGIRQTQDVTGYKKVYFKRNDQIYATKLDETAKKIFDKETKNFDTDIAKKYFDIDVNSPIVIFSPADQVYAQLNIHDDIKEYTPLAGEEYVTGTYELSDGRKIKLTEDSYIKKMTINNTDKRISFEVDEQKTKSLTGGGNKTCLVEMYIPKSDNVPEQTVKLINGKDIKKFIISKKNGDILSFKGDRTCWYNSESIRLSDKYEIKTIDENNNPGKNKRTQINEIEFKNDDGGFHEVTFNCSIDASASGHEMKMFKMNDKIWSLGNNIETMKVYDNKIVLKTYRHHLTVNLEIDGKKLIENGKYIDEIEIDPNTLKIISVKAKVGEAGPHYPDELEGKYMVGDATFDVTGCNVGEIKKSDNENEKFKISGVKKKQAGADAPDLTAELKGIINMTYTKNNEDGSSEKKIFRIKATEVKINELSIGENNQGYVVYAATGTDGSSANTLNALAYDPNNEENKKDEEGEAEIEEYPVGSGEYYLLGDDAVVDNFALCNLRVITKRDNDGKIHYFLRWKVVNGYDSKLTDRTRFCIEKSPVGLICNKIEVDDESELKIFAVQPRKTVAIDVEKNTSIVLKNGAIEFTPVKGTMLEVDGVNRKNNRNIPFLLQSDDADCTLTLYKDSCYIAKANIFERDIAVEEGRNKKEDVRAIYLANKIERANDVGEGKQKLIFCERFHSAGAETKEEKEDKEQKKKILNKGGEYNMQFNADIVTKTLFAINGDTENIESANRIDGDGYKSGDFDDRCVKIDNSNGDYTLDNGDILKLDHDKISLKKNEIKFQLNQNETITINEEKIVANRGSSDDSDVNYYMDKKDGKISCINCDDKRFTVLYAKLDKDTYLNLEGCNLKKISRKDEDGDDFRYEIDVFEPLDDDDKQDPTKYLASEKLIKFDNGNELDVGNAFLKQIIIDDYNKRNGKIKLLPMVVPPPLPGPPRVDIGEITISIGNTDVVNAWHYDIESISLDRKAGYIKCVKARLHNCLQGSFLFQKEGIFFNNLDQTNNVKEIEQVKLTISDEKKKGVKLTGPDTVGQYLKGRIQFFVNGTLKGLNIDPSFKIKSITVDKDGKIIAAEKENVSHPDQSPVDLQPNQLVFLNSHTRDIDSHGNNINNTPEGYKDVEMTMKIEDNVDYYCIKDDVIDDFVFSDVQIVENPNNDGTITKYLRYRKAPTNENLLCSKLTKHAKFRLKLGWMKIIDDIITSAYDQLKVGISLDANNKNELTVFDIEQNSFIVCNNNFIFTPKNITTIKHKKINNGKIFITNNTCGARANVVICNTIIIDVNDGAIMEVSPFMKTAYKESKDGEDIDKVASPSPPSSRIAGHNAFHFDDSGNIMFDGAVLVNENEDNNCRLFSNIDINDGALHLSKCNIIEGFSDIGRKDVTCVYDENGVLQAYKSVNPGGGGIREVICNNADEVPKSYWLFDSNGGFVTGDFPLQNNSKGNILHLKGTETNIDKIRVYDEEKKEGEDGREESIAEAEIDFKPMLNTTLRGEFDDVDADILKNVSVQDGALKITLNTKNGKCKKAHVDSLNGIMTDGLISFEGMSFKLTGSNIHEIDFTNKERYTVSSCPNSSLSNFNNFLCGDVYDFANFDIKNINKIRVEGDKVFLIPIENASVDCTINGKQCIKNGRNIECIEINRKTGTIMSVYAKTAEVAEKKENVGLQGIFCINNVTIDTTGCCVGEIKLNGYSHNEGRFVACPGVEIKAAEQKLPVAPGGAGAEPVAPVQTKICSLNGELNVSNIDPIGDEKKYFLKLDRKPIKEIVVNKDGQVTDVKLMNSNLETDKNNVIRGLNKTKMNEDEKKKEEDEMQKIEDEINNILTGAGANDFQDDHYYRLEIAPEKNIDGTDKVEYKIIDNNADIIAQHVNISEMSIETAYDKTNGRTKYYLKWKYNKNKCGNIGLGSKIVVEKVAMGLKLKGIRLDQFSNMYVCCRTPFDKKHIKIVNGIQVDDDCSIYFDEDGGKTTSFCCGDSKIMHPDVRVQKPSGDDLCFKPFDKIKIYNDTQNLAMLSHIDSARTNVKVKILGEFIDVQQGNIEFENSEENRIKKCKTRGQAFFNKIANVRPANPGEQSQIAVDDNVEIFLDNQTSEFGYEENSYVFKTLNNLTINTKTEDYNDDNVNVNVEANSNIRISKNDEGKIVVTGCINSDNDISIKNDFSKVLPRNKKHGVIGPVIVDDFTCATNKPISIDKNTNRINGFVPDECIELEKNNEYMNFVDQKYVNPRDSDIQVTNPATDILHLKEQFIKFDKDGGIKHAHIGCCLEIYADKLDSLAERKQVALGELNKCDLSGLTELISAIKTEIINNNFAQAVAKIREAINDIPAPCRGEVDDNEKKKNKKYLNNALNALSIKLDSAIDFNEENEIEFFHNSEAFEYIDENGVKNIAPGTISCEKTTENKLKFKFDDENLPNVPSFKALVNYTLMYFGCQLEANGDLLNIDEDEDEILIGSQDGGEILNTDNSLQIIDHLGDNSPMLKIGDADSSNIKSIKLERGFITLIPADPNNPVNLTVQYADGTEETIIKNGIGIGEIKLRRPDMQISSIIAGVDLLDNSLCLSGEYQFKNETIDINEYNKCASITSSYYERDNKEHVTLKAIADEQLAGIIYVKKSKAGDISRVKVMRTEEYDFRDMTISEGEFENAYRISGEYFNTENKFIAQFNQVNAEVKMDDSGNIDEGEQFLDIKLEKNVVHYMGGSVQDGWRIESDDDVDFYANCLSIVTKREHDGSTGYYLRCKKPLDNVLKNVHADDIKSVLTKEDNIINFDKHPMFGFMLKNIKTKGNKIKFYVNRSNNAGMEAGVGGARAVADNKQQMAVVNVREHTQICFYNGLTKFQPSGNALGLENISGINNSHLTYVKDIVIYNKDNKIAAVKTDGAYVNNALPGGKFEYAYGGNDSIIFKKDGSVQSYADDVAIQELENQILDDEKNKVSFKEFFPIINSEEIKEEDEIWKIDTNSTNAQAVVLRDKNNNFYNHIVPKFEIDNDDAKDSKYPNLVRKIELNKGKKPPYERQFLKITDADNVAGIDEFSDKIIIYFNSPDEATELNITDASGEVVSTIATNIENRTFIVIDKDGKLKSFDAIEDLPRPQLLSQFKQMLEQRKKTEQEIMKLREQLKNLLTLVSEAVNLNPFDDEIDKLAPLANQLTGDDINVVRRQCFHPDNQKSFLKNLKDTFGYCYSHFDDSDNVKKLCFLLKQFVPLYEQQTQKIKQMLEFYPELTSELGYEFRLEELQYKTLKNHYDNNVSLKGALTSNVMNNMPGGVLKINHHVEMVKLQSNLLNSLTKQSKSLKYSCDVFSLLLETQQRLVDDPERLLLEPLFGKLNVLMEWLEVVGKPEPLFGQLEKLRELLQDPRLGQLIRPVKPYDNEVSKKAKQELQRDIKKQLETTINTFQMIWRAPCESLKQIVEFQLQRLRELDIQLSTRTVAQCLKILLNSLCKKQNIVVDNIFFFFQANHDISAIMRKELHKGLEERFSADEVINFLSRRIATISLFGSCDINNNVLSSLLTVALESFSVNEGNILFDNPKTAMQLSLLLQQKLLETDNNLPNQDQVFQNQLKSQQQLFELQQKLLDQPLQTLLLFPEQKNEPVELNNKREQLAKLERDLRPIHENIEKLKEEIKKDEENYLNTVEKTNQKNQLEAERQEIFKQETELLDYITNAEKRNFPLIDSAFLKESAIATVNSYGCVDSYAIYCNYYNNNINGQLCNIDNFLDMFNINDNFFNESYDNWYYCSDEEKYSLKREKLISVLVENYRQQEQQNLFCNLNNNFKEQLKESVFLKEMFLSSYFQLLKNPRLQRTLLQIDNNVELCDDKQIGDLLYKDLSTLASNIIQQIDYALSGNVNIDTDYVSNLQNNLEHLKPMLQSQQFLEETDEELVIDSDRCKQLLTQIKMDLKPIMDLKILLGMISGDVNQDFSYEEMQRLMHSFQESLQFNLDDLKSEMDDLNRRKKAQKHQFKAIQKIDSEPIKEQRFMLVDSLPKTIKKDVQELKKQLQKLGLTEDEKNNLSTQLRVAEQLQQLTQSQIDNDYFGFYSSVIDSAKNYCNKDKCIDIPRYHMQDCKSDFGKTTDDINLNIGAYKEYENNTYAFVDEDFNWFRDIVLDKIKELLAVTLENNIDNVEAPYMALCQKAKTKLNNEGFAVDNDTIIDSILLGKDIKGLVKKIFDSRRYDFIIDYRDKKQVTKLALDLAKLILHGFAVESTGLPGGGKIDVKKMLQTKKDLFGFDKMFNELRTSFCKKNSSGISETGKNDDKINSLDNAREGESAKNIENFNHLSYEEKQQYLLEETRREKMANIAKRSSIATKKNKIKEDEKEDKKISFPDGHFINKKDNKRDVDWFNFNQKNINNNTTDIKDLEDQKEIINQSENK